jgi:chromosome segregation ATPase
MQYSPPSTATFDPTAQEFSPQPRNDYPLSLFHERHPPYGKAQALDGKSRVSSSAESESVYSPSPYGLWTAHPSPTDSPIAQLDRLDQSISNHIKDIHNHIGQAKDGLVLHIKEKHAASACLVKTRYDSIETLNNKHHEETSKNLEMLSDDVTLIRNETVDVAAGLESVTDFAAKINDTFTAEFESIEKRLALVDKKLDTIGRAVSTMDRRLITAKDDFNEVNFKVGGIKESNTALRADCKSLREKTDILMERNEAEAEWREDISNEMNSIQRAVKDILDDQATLMTTLRQMSESVTLLQTENETLRLKNQKLRESSSNSAPQIDLKNRLFNLLQKLEARESRIDQIFNIV